MTGCTEERRRKQAEAIRQWKPWEKSTGPKTPEGKARSSRNACSADAEKLREAARIIRLNRETLRAFCRFCLLGALKYEK